MSEGGLLFPVISITSAIVCLSLGIYVLIKNPYLKSSKLFIILATIATLTSLAIFLMIIAPDSLALSRRQMAYGCSIFT